ncbi:MAG: MbcA/ParS/Xre antitoxin family protein [Steroidobacteraceae bacterium]
MTTLTRVASEARPFSPEPITDDEAAAMFRAVLNLFRLWGVTDDQAAIILDLNRRTYARWKAGDLGRMGRDGKARLSNLVGIHKALRIVFRDAARGYAWIKASNEAFDGRSALDVMLGGELTDLMRVRRYLDAERGGW